MTRSGESSITDAIADSLGFVGQVIGIVAICAMLWLLSRFLSKDRVYSIKDCTIEWETDPYTFNKGEARHKARLVIKNPYGDVVGRHEYSGDRSVRNTGVLTNLYMTQKTPKAKLKSFAPEIEIPDGCLDDLCQYGIRTSLMAAALVVDYCRGKPRNARVRAVDLDRMIQDITNQRDGAVFESPKVFYRKFGFNDMVGGEMEMPPIDLTRNLQRFRVRDDVDEYGIKVLRLFDTQT